MKKCCDWPMRGVQMIESRSFKSLRRKEEERACGADALAGKTGRYCVDDNHAMVRKAKLGLAKSMDMKW